MTIGWGPGMGGFSSDGSRMDLLLYHSLADRFFMQERTRKYQIPSAFTQVYAGKNSTCP